MAAITSSVGPSTGRRWLAALWAGFHVPWTTFLLILLVNTGFAAVYWIEDPRPFWHPFVSVQCDGLAMAYCVNVAQPWAARRPLVPLVIAVAIGAAIGIGLTIIIKDYAPAHVIEHQKTFALNYTFAFFNGLFVSLFFLLKHREARAAERLHQAEAAHQRLEKQAVESELKLMQAQVEPHFLFNTLASVQYLTETDPPQATLLLGHLLAYLRAALPQLRKLQTTLGQEIDLATAYLNILRMRMGARLAFVIDVPELLRAQPFPPVLLISVVENAITHGLEPMAEGGNVAIQARTEGARLVVSVIDNGIGLSAVSRPGQGVGLANVRERLAALYGNRGRFTLADEPPHGARATIEIPFEG